MKQITTIILGILMIAGAMAMYGGESITFETNLINPVYTVVGNQSSLGGLNITFENGNITISPALNYMPDNFTLIFFDNQTREVEKIVHRGRGSSRTEYVDRNVTVYVPEYINRTEIIEVEKIVEVQGKRITEVRYGFEAWEVLSALAVGLIIMWVIMRSKAKREKIYE